MDTKSEYMTFTFFYGFCFRICPKYLIENILRRDPEFLDDCATDEGFYTLGDAVKFCMGMKQWTKEHIKESLLTCPSPHLKRFVLEHLL